MAYKFEYGDKLVVELTNGDVLYGDHVRSFEHMVELKNIEQKGGPLRKSGVTRFFRSDISKLFIAEKKEQKAIEEPPCENKSENQGAVPKVKQKQRLHDEDSSYLLDRLIDVSENYVYISEVKDAYKEAFSALQNVGSVGLLGIGSEKGRKEKLTLVVLSSWEQVYIFDCCENAQFFEDLRTFLVKYRPLKITHDGQTLTDCLRHNYKINVTNVFDTMLADLELQKKKHCSDDLKIRNLYETVHNYLSFPKHVLQRAASIDVSTWRERPLNDELKFRAAELCSVLHILRDKIKSKMLGYHYDIVKDVYRHYLSFSDFQAKVVLNEKVVSPIVTEIIKKRIPHDSDCKK